jgi:hypothetical protein
VAAAGSRGCSVPRRLHARRPPPVYGSGTKSATPPGSRSPRRWAAGCQPKLVVSVADDSIGRGRGPVSFWSHRPGRPRRRLRWHPQTSQ